MDGGNRPDPAVYITLRELYDLLCDTRDRLGIMSNDIRWVKDASDDFDLRLRDLQTEIRALRAENVEIRAQLGDAKADRSGLRAIIETATSIGSMLLSIAVAIYVAMIRG